MRWPARVAESGASVSPIADSLLKFVAAITYWLSSRSFGAERARAGVCLRHAEKAKPTTDDALGQLLAGPICAAGPGRLSKSTAVERPLVRNSAADRGMRNVDQENAHERMLLPALETQGRFRGRGLETAEPAFTPLKGRERFGEIVGLEIRPHPFGEMQFGVSALPKQEVG
jgi:hypothetical protein